jgi:tetratricopeptide (TPR) repeat protein
MPDPHITLLTAARELAGRGDFAKAVQTVLEAIEQEPDDPTLHEEMYRYCMITGSTNSAINAAAELRRIQPKSGNYAYMHGIAMLAAGQLQEAKKILEDALALAPESWEIRQGLAQVLRVLREHPRATQLLEEAVNQNPTQPGPVNDLAVVYLAEPDGAAKAVRILGKVLEANPDEPGANLNMALALRATNPAVARVHAEKALKSDEDDVREQARRLLKHL